MQPERFHEIVAWVIAELHRGNVDNAIVALSTIELLMQENKPILLS